jgi:RNA polymerase sigma-70 factor (sigma-E family)
VTFEDAYRRHYQAVVRSAWAICRDSHRAEELTQEAFARAYRRWRKLVDGGYAVPWLHRVVMNLALSDVRRRRRGRELETVAHAGAVMFAAQPGGGDPDWVVQTLRRLPRRQREAVFLRIVADLPVDQVATLMSCSPGSVKTHTKRGLDRLRDLLVAGTTEGDTDGRDRAAAQAALG